MEILRAAHGHRNILVFGKKQEAWNEVATTLNSNPIFAGCVRASEAGRQAGSVRDELNGLDDLERGCGCACARTTHKHILMMSAAHATS
jgi:hypothetical protein